MSTGMEIFAARLASFDTVLYSSKGGTSSVKGGKSISWPHSRPSPAELAFAGFYYTPYETNPDNTICFLCKRALDGWEEDDNPITEHLKHSNDCGWAIMMNVQQQSSNPAEIENPTSPRIVEARQATFNAMWPHDGKKGWICQSDKMVEAGWYFCPSDESPDLASCAYCNLSLDGWEPKDDPLEEHYRRSPDCSFFIFAQVPGKGKKKPTRSKKSQVSRAARLSTQSTMTAASEATTLDHDDTMDISHISQSIVKTTKGAKRGPKAKSKSSKTRNDDAIETNGHADADTLDEVQSPVAAKSTRATRGRKRTTNEISQDNPSMIVVQDPDFESQPAPKRRTTQIRRSDSFSNQEPTIEMPLAEQGSLDDAVPESGVKKTRPPAKRGRVSKASKSANTRASKTSTRNQVPDESQLEAATVTALNIVVDNVDMGEVHEDDIVALDMPLEKLTAKSQKQSAIPSKAPVQASTHESRGFKHGKGTEQNIDDHPEAANTAPETALKTSSKRKVANKRSKKDTDVNLQLQVVKPNSQREKEEDAAYSRLSHSQSSLLSIEIHANPLEDNKANTSDTTFEVSQKPGKKKAASSKGKRVGKGRKAKTQASTTVEGDLDADEGRIDNVSTQADDQPMQHPVTRQFGVPQKTTERFSNISKKEHRAQSLLASFAKEAEGTDVGDAAAPVSKTITVEHDRTQTSTPSPSPQSSDAENQPPSSRPSAIRPPLISPSQNKITRIPLAASTPKQSPSRRQEQIGYLTGAKMWTPIDLKCILELGADKENFNTFSSVDQAKDLLTSPEKRMTVEEWIFWQAENGEEKLKRECERLVTLFENEGGRAMRVVEGIECIE